MRVTSKGQVTIPQRIRNRHGLKPGTAVEFVSEGGKVVLRSRKRAKNPVESWLTEATGYLRGRTTDQLMQITRGED